MALLMPERARRSSPGYGIALGIAALGITAPCVVMSADNYPNRPVTIVVPFAPGATGTILARLSAEALQRQLKAPFVVENRTGAGGIIGTAAVANSPPDGYMLLHADSSFAISPYTAKITFDPEKDFDPVAIYATTNFVVLVNPKLNINSMKDLIERAKANPTELTFGSAGAGTGTHLYAELLNSMAGIKIQHIPYRGTAAALVDVMSGQVSMIISVLPSALPTIRDGRLKAIATTSLTRDSQLPDVPTVAETVAGYEAVGWQGILAKAGTPKPIVDTLNNVIVENVKHPDTLQRFETIGANPKLATPNESREWIRKELEKFKNVAASAGIVPN